MSKAVHSLSIDQDCTIGSWLVVEFSELQYIHYLQPFYVIKMNKTAKKLEPKDMKCPSGALPWHKSAFARSAQGL